MLLTSDVRMAHTPQRLPPPEERTDSQARTEICIRWPWILKPRSLTAVMSLVSASKGKVFGLARITQYDAFASRPIFDFKDNIVKPISQLSIYSALKSSFSTSNTPLSSQFEKEFKPKYTKAIPLFQVLPILVRPHVLCALLLSNSFLSICRHKDSMRSLSRSPPPSTTLSRAISLAIRVRTANQRSISASPISSF